MDGVAKTLRTVYSPKTPPNAIHPLETKNGRSPSTTPRRTRSVRSPERTPPTSARSCPSPAARAQSQLTDRLMARPKRWEDDAVEKRKRAQKLVTMRQQYDVQTYFHDGAGKLKSAATVLNDRRDLEDCYTGVSLANIPPLPSPQSKETQKKIGKMLLLRQMKEYGRMIREKHADETRNLSDEERQQKIREARQKQLEQLQNRDRERKQKQEKLEALEREIEEIRRAQKSSPRPGRPSSASTSAVSSPHAALAKVVSPQVERRKQRQERLDALEKEVEEIMKRNKKVHVSPDMLEKKQMAEAREKLQQIRQARAVNADQYRKIASPKRWRSPFSKYESEQKTKGVGVVEQPWKSSPGTGASASYFSPQSSSSRPTPTSTRSAPGATTRPKTPSRPSSATVVPKVRLEQQVQHIGEAISAYMNHELGVELGVALDALEAQMHHQRMLNLLQTHFARPLLEFPDVITEEVWRSLFGKLDLMQRRFNAFVSELEQHVNMLLDKMASASSPRSPRSPRSNNTSITDLLLRHEAMIMYYVSYVQDLDVSLGLLHHAESSNEAFARFVQGQERELSVVPTANQLPLTLRSLLFSPLQQLMSFRAMLSQEAPTIDSFQMIQIISRAMDIEIHDPDQPELLLLSPRGTDGPLSPVANIRGAFDATPMPTQ